MASPTVCGVLDDLFGRQGFIATKARAMLSLHSVKLIFRAELLTSLADLARQFSV
jgi:hypothetical protein